nr:patatin-like phospholipase family protein [uncultured Pedobacter sp.]
MSLKKSIFQNKNMLLLMLVAMAMNFLSSCVNNKIVINSNTRYKPIPAIETKFYKSPQEREGQASSLALGVAISGGGSRAQYFGTGVLIALDEIKKDQSSFLNEVDYFSTVSGGGFAAGYYLTLKKNNILDKYPSYFDYWKSDARKKRFQEFLFKGASAITIAKLPGYERNAIFKSYPSMIDHELLQLGKPDLEDKPIDTMFLSDFFIPVESSDKKVRFPIFVTNGTIYNNGERLPFMPHIINALRINGSLLPKKQFEINKGYGFPLSYAISGSAAFPGVLPMLKLSIKNTDSVIRVIDGGAVDNLGYATLLELLHLDRVSLDKKRMLVIDCGGLGNEVQQQPNGRVSYAGLISKALMYTVDINILYADNNIKYIANYYHIDQNNIKRIGISTIKNKFFELEKSADQKSVQELEVLKKNILKGRMNWTDVYNDFASEPMFKGYINDNISEVPSDLFKNFSLKQVFELYELSSQVDTKIKIFDWEKEILVLAGRYAVSMEQAAVRDLIK